MRARSNSEGSEGMAAARPAAGEMLRDARAATGQTLEHVAAALRIRLVYLRAIEDGRYEELPGAAYAGGFLRSFAEHVGLDPEAIVRLYKEEMKGRESKQELYFPTPAGEGRVPGGTLLFATLLLAGAVYGGWYYLSATDRSVVDVVPALPDRLVALVQGLPWRFGGEDAAGEAERPSSSALPDSNDFRPIDVPVSGGAAPPAATPTTSGAAPAGSAPAPASTAVPSAPPPTAPATPPQANAPRKTESAPSAGNVPMPNPAAPAAMTTPAPSAVAASTAPAPIAAAIQPPAETEEEGDVQAPTPLTAEASSLASAETQELTAPAPELPEPTRVFGQQNEGSRIQLRATQDSWIQVKDGGGDLLFTRVLKPGEVYRVPDRPGIRVRTGNAGGLIVVTDGVAGPPMGAVGQVLRDVPLDAPSLRPTNG